MLGAGGEAGIAWEVGLLAGLAERGTDLTAADLVIGTSAGAGVAAGSTRASAWRRSMRRSSHRWTGRSWPGSARGR